MMAMDVMRMDDKMMTTRTMTMTMTRELVRFDRHARCFQKGQHDQRPYRRGNYQPCYLLRGGDDDG